MSFTKLNNIMCTGWLAMLVLAVIVNINGIPVYISLGMAISGVIFSFFITRPLCQLLDIVILYSNKQEEFIETLRKTVDLQDKIINKNKKEVQNGNEK